jgi:RNA polymerase-binding transcription factor DksA
MDLNANTIYSELRSTKKELMEKLESENYSLLAKPFIEEELKDVEKALRKFEAGTFGTCEMSGELLPEKILLIVPTLTSLDDCKTLEFFIGRS